MQTICPELNETGATQGQLKAEKLPDLKHLIILNNPDELGLQIKYPGCWSYEELSTRRFSLVDEKWPYVDSDDLFLIHYTVKFYLTRKLSFMYYGNF